MSAWQYRIKDVIHDPVTDKQLKGLSDKGVITPFDSVRKAGTKEWIEAKRIKGLFAPETIQAFENERAKRIMNERDDDDSESDDQQENPPAKKASSFRIGSLLGGVIVVISFYMMISYYMMDTSVAVPGGSGFGIGRVNNIGLMRDQQNGLIVSVVIFAVGALVMYASRRR